MKSLSLFTSAIVLLSATSALAIDCATLPSCASLGYNDIVSQCPKSSVGEDLAVKCPFDATKGKCIYEAAVGQIGYFTKAPNVNSGWILCDGQAVSSSMYPQLSKLLGTQFGGSGSTFNVPDYRGFFLRVYAESEQKVRSGFTTFSGDLNTSLTEPQKEGLPNIKGTITSDHASTTEDLKVKWDNTGGYETIATISGAFNSAEKFDKAYATGDSGVGYLVYFNASKYNSIYGRPEKSGSGLLAHYKDTRTHVVPGNMAVYAYIYAGRVIK